MESCVICLEPCFKNQLIKCSQCRSHECKSCFKQKLKQREQHRCSICRKNLDYVFLCKKLRKWSFISTFVNHILRKETDPKYIQETMRHQDSFVHINQTICHYMALIHILEHEKKTLIIKKQEEEKKNYEITLLDDRIYDIDNEIIDYNQYINHHIGLQCELHPCDIESSYTHMNEVSHEFNQVLSDVFFETLNNCNLIPDFYWFYELRVSFFHKRISRKYFKKQIRDFVMYIYDFFTYQHLLRVNAPLSERFSRKVNRLFNVNV